MSISKRDWLGLAAPLVGLGLLWLLGPFLLPGVALTLAVTTAMAWGYYWKSRRVDFVVIPITIALALGTAQFFPDAWRFPIAAVFTVSGGLLVLWLQQRLRPASVPN